jgi:uncharacterized protein (DUF2235 family)
MRQKRNCILLTEGTGQGIPDDYSNVTILARSLVADASQRIHLLPGPGVDTPAKLSGWAFGAGVLNRVASHLAFLAKERETAGDDVRIFIFGFSRGALAARYLADIVCKTGVPSSPSLARRILKYHRTGEKEKLEDMRKNGKLSKPLEVEYLGAWDSVDSTLEVDGSKIVNVPRLVKRARHAVAADEKRCFFAPLEMRGENCEEMFFPGSHQDVGGGYVDNHVLSDVALAWIANPAIDAGMRLKDGISFSEDFNPSQAIVHDSSSMPSNLFGILPDFVRKLDIKRFHRSLALMRDFAAGKKRTARKSENKIAKGQSPSLV